MAYLMYPDIYGNKLAFVTEDDLWIMDLNDGKPLRLTSGLGAVTRAKFSNDGTLIAFTRFQTSGSSIAEVYVIPSEGGEAKRITWFGSPTTNVLGWSPEGKVIVSSDFQSPFAAWRNLFEIDPNGGEPKRLDLGPVTSIAYGEKALVIGRNNYDLTYWKRYKGGTRGVFWIDRGYTGNFVKFLDLNGNLTSPIWIGDRFYFVSDHEGIGNLYSVDLEGKDLRKHTDMNDFYVRNANSDGKRIVFQAGGDIYLYDDQKLIKLDIRAPVSGKQKQIFFDESRNVSDYYPISSEEIGIITRGRAFLLNPWEGAPLPLGDNTGLTRYKMIHSDEETVAVVKYDDVVELYDKEGNLKEELKPDVGTITRIAVYKSNLIIANKRGELIVLSSGNKTVLDKSDYGELSDFSVGPDGWIAYSKPEGTETSSIWVSSLDGKKYRITNPTGKDFMPSFSKDGRYLFFLSIRHFDPVLDEIVFNYDFPASTKPFVAVMKKGVPSPFLSTKGDGEFNPDDAIRRVEAFPIDAGIYRKVRHVKEGKVALLKFPIEGRAKYWLYSSAERVGSLIIYDMTTSQQEEVVNDAIDFEVLEGNVIVREKGNLMRIINVDKRPDLTSRDPGRRSGVIDLSRIKIRVEPAKEWRQMVKETWYLMKHNYWKGLDEDWDKVLNKYEKLLEKVNTRYELMDVINELQGENGTSHSYQIVNELRVEKPYTVGGLGVQVRFNGECYEITRIFYGDLSAENEKSPLLSSGLDVKEGDCITSIDGVKLTKEVTPQEILLNKQDVPVLVKIVHDRKEVSVSVKTVRNESYLVYRDWVRRNREYVEKKTEGKVGYIHIPDMGPMGFAEFVKDFTHQMDKKAMIVDVRYNRGGHVSPLIISYLSRQRIGADLPRDRKPSPYLPFSPPPAMVCLTDEHAGSDGDIFTHVFKRLKLGKVIGVRTWGGVIGINPKIRLIDGTTVTQPEFASWFDDVKFGIENYGVDPDLWVDISPQDYRNGIDPQLDEGIKASLEAMEKSKDILEEAEKDRESIVAGKVKNV